MARLIALGDSFVVGDQDDFGPNDCNYNPKFPPTHNMSYDERLEYLKNNVSFVSIIAKKLNYDLVNLAERGQGNFNQMDNLIRYIIEYPLTKDDIILYGVATTTRDRIRMSEYIKNKDVEICDLFYVISFLNQITLQYGTRVIKFNIFENLYSQYTDKKIICKTIDFLGENQGNNTLVDILNDTWGDGDGKKPYHTRLSIPTEFKKFYTWNNHPSILGHEKLAEWFLKNTFS